MRAIKAFTLIELLITIAILAILGSTVVIVLNPAELLAEARDSQRVSDLLTVEKSISLLRVDQPSVSLGSTLTVYISVPDDGAVNPGTCGSYTAVLTTLPSGWAYRCVTTDNLRKVDGAGWLPFNFQLISGGSPMPSLPIDPVNSTSSYYTYVASSQGLAISGDFESQKYRTIGSGFFSTKIVKGSAPGLAAIPSGGDWINVPGNSAFGTSNFSVMKYEVKCLDSDGNPLVAPNSGYDTYSNSGQACSGVRYVASVRGGFPIANISHDTAKSYCASIGAHLLTNEEYMTIARSAENVGSNWSGGSSGSGYLFSGHNDNSPAKALAASLDSDNYSGTGNSSGNQRRTFTLSNGEVIWDIPGNVWEHVQRTASDTVTTITTPACSSGTGWQWCEYGATTAPYITNYGADAALSYIGPSNASWNSNQGVGRVYTNSGLSGGTVFLRGGNWGYGSTAGAFTLNLSWSSGTTSNSVGFRCAR